jgi:hypothetical protein
MKRRSTILGLLLAVGLLMIACTVEMKYNLQPYEVKKVSLEELKEFAFGHTTPIGEWFWDTFNKFRQMYALSDDEDKLLGRWESFEDWGTTPGYSFFPNKLFVGDVFTYYYALKTRPNARLVNVIGTWEIKNGKVTVAIYGCLFETHREGFGYDYEYQTCKPYDVNVIKIGHVDPIGYTLRAFKYMPLPKELKNDLVKGKVLFSDLKRQQSARYLSDLHVITNYNFPDYSYYHFNFFPAMALRNLTGKEIAQSPGLLMEVFKGFQFGSYSYHDLSMEFPKEFPEL